MQIQSAFSYYVDAKRANGRAPRTISDYNTLILKRTMTQPFG
jgi:hypothetical protein